MNEKIKTIRAIGITSILIFVTLSAIIESKGIDHPQDIPMVYPITNEKEKTIEIVVTEHTIDKTISKKIHKMYLCDFEALQKQLATAPTMGDKFEVLKSYNIVTNDMNSKKYADILRKTVKNYDFSEKNSPKTGVIQITSNIMWLQNFMCGVLLTTEGINIPIGFSLLTAYINEDLFDKYRLLIPSIDILDLCIGSAYFRTRGPLGGNRFGGDKTFSGLVGFAGISLREKDSVFTSRTGIYLGFSLYAYSIIFQN
jgi:hypothetical protein